MDQGFMRPPFTYFATPSRSRSDLDSAEEYVSSFLALPMLSTRGTPSSLAALSQDSSTPREHLTDPFDGSTIGMLIPIAEHPSEETNAGNEDLWAHLSRVLDLQTEIARMHVEMEGVGIGKGKGKGKVGEGKDRGRGNPGERRTGSGQSHTDTDTEEYDVEGEGVEMDDEETERNRAREEEFAKLADQFEGRKESINEMMDRLDNLSKALTEFHALQAPELKMPFANWHEATPPAPVMSTPSGLSKSALWALANSRASSTTNLPGSLSRR